MSPARLNITLGQESAGLYEDPSALMRAYNMGGISLVFREYLGEEWSEIPFSLNLVFDEGVTVSAMRRQFGIFALTADVDILSQAKSQDSDTPATPTIIPLPEISPPETRGSGAAFGLLIAGLAPYIVMLWYMKMIGMRR